MYLPLPWTVNRTEIDSPASGKSIICSPEYASYEKFTACVVEGDYRRSEDLFSVITPAGPRLRRVGCSYSY